MKALTKSNENKTMCIRRRPFTVRQIFQLLVSRRRARSRCASCDSPFLVLYTTKELTASKLYLSRQPHFLMHFLNGLGKFRRLYSLLNTKGYAKYGNATKTIDIAVENVYNQVVNAYKILVKEYFWQHKQTI